MSAITGKVWKYGNDVNTDVIFPGKYTYTISNPAEMPAHALEDLDPRFAEEVQSGDIIVAGRNWGCGSSREQAVTCLKESGVGAIIATSFARIFYRNCINAALPALQCPPAVKQISAGEVIEVQLERGLIVCAAGEIPFEPIPPSVMRILEADGLVAYTRQRLEEKQTRSHPGN